MSETLGVHPDTGLYHTDYMPLPDDEALRQVREKQLAGEQLTLGEALRAGRDNTVPEIPEPVGEDVHHFPLKPDHVYRAVSRDTLRVYEEAGAVVGFGDHDEYEPGNNKGVDWFLGGVAVSASGILKYGDMVLETPADPAFFQPAHEQGSNLAIDPGVRHMKSSGSANPVPMDLVKVAHDGREHSRVA
jgi:hypothetical protein